MHGGERHAESRILHADLKAEGAAFGGIHARHAADHVAEAHADGVLDGNHEEGDEACVHDARLGGRNHGGDDDHDGRHGDERQRAGDILNTVAEDAVNQDARADRNEDYLDDREEHRGRVDREPFARKGVHQGGRHDWRHQRRAGRDRDGERHIAAGEEGDDVRGRSARAAAQEHQTDGEVGRQIKGLAEHEGRDRHDRELRNDADDHVLRAGKDLAEVRGRQGETHAEHDDAEKEGYPGASKYEYFRK